MSQPTAKTNLLLTGLPGVGKTTVIQKVAQSFEGRGQVAGFITEEIRRRGQRVGFALLPIGGSRSIMAHRDLVSAHRVGRYGVDVEQVSYVADVALSARGEIELFFVDEIGKMECFSRRFIRAMQRLLDDPRPLVATVALRGSGFIDEVKRRDDVEIWEVTRDNRQELGNAVGTWIASRTARDS